MALTEKQVHQVREVAVTLLQQDSFQGHTYSLLHAVVQTTSQRVRGRYEDVLDALQSQMEGSVVIEGKAIMLEELYSAEQTVVSRVNALLRRFN